MHCLTWRGEKQTERANRKDEMTRETEWEQQFLVAVAIESEREERERQVRDGCEKERLRREEERDSKNREKNPEHKDAHLDPGWLNAFQTRPIGRASEKKKNALAANVYLNAYLQKGYDERSQGEVGGFLELGVEFFDG